MKNLLLMSMAFALASCGTQSGPVEDLGFGAKVTWGGPDYQGDSNSSSIVRFTIPL